MAVGLLGKKLGMTRIFTDDGRSVCVTAVEAGPCAVLSVKEKSVQVGFEEIAEKRLKKPVAGYFKKCAVSPRAWIREVPKDAARTYTVGEALTVTVFAQGDYVDVSGISIGKGFQGGMKRWNWAGGPMTHGSTSHRRIGSLGSSTTPGRVWKGHHLPGHMGNIRVTVQNLKIVKVDAERNLLLIEGAVPGAKNGLVEVRTAVKKAGKIKKQAPQPKAGAKKK